jgi:1,4-alpha-glucan branching enzyme
MHQLDFERLGFEWIDIQDWEKSIISFLRRGLSPDHLIVIVCNFTPVFRQDYRVGVPRGGFWKEILNSDASEYGGSGKGNMGGVTAEAHPYHGRDYSFSITLPPFGALFFKSDP